MKKSKGGKPARNKGRRGQRAAQKLLQSYGYETHELNSGTKTGDLIAIVDDHVTGKHVNHLIEVKNTKSIDIPAFLKQARYQAKSHKMKWMLMCKLTGGFGWIVFFEGEKDAEMWYE